MIPRMLFLKLRSCSRSSTIPLPRCRKCKPTSWACRVKLTYRLMLRGLALTHLKRKEEAEKVGLRFGSYRRGLTKSAISSHTVYNPLTRSPSKVSPNSTRKSRIGRSLGDFMSRGFSRPIMSRSFEMAMLIVGAMPMDALLL
jgi:hypothetical protein